jgi:hypothetical protein
MVEYKAQVDAQGKPVKDANGRFAKGELNGYASARRSGGHAITVQVKRAAPDMQTEIDTIDEFERDIERKPTNDWRREQDRGHLRSVLRLIWFNWDVFSDRPLSLTEGIALEVALEQIKLFLFQQIHEDFGKPDLTAEDREVLEA